MNQSVLLYLNFFNVNKVLLYLLCSPRSTSSTNYENGYLWPSLSNLLLLLLNVCIQLEMKRMPSSRTVAIMTGDATIPALKRNESPNAHNFMKPPSSSQYPTPSTRSTLHNATDATIHTVEIIPNKRVLIATESEICRRLVTSS